MGVGVGVGDVPASAVAIADIWADVRLIPLIAPTVLSAFVICEAVRPIFDDDASAPWQLAQYEA